MLFEFVRELDPLLNRHHEECGALGLALDPDWALYAALEQAGKFKAFTARSSGALAGYGGFLIQPSLHKKGLLTITNDVFFLADRHRAGRNGLRFIEYCEREIGKMFGVCALTWGARPGSALQTILSRDGYEVESRMSKILKEA